MPKPKYHAKAKRAPKTRERKAKRIAGLWESCKVCMEQMVGGPRCWTHNPLPNDDRPYVRNIVVINGEEFDVASLQSAGEVAG